MVSFTEVITFSDARMLVEGFPEIRDVYPSDDFHVAEYGWEDDSRFLIVAGTYADVFGGTDIDSLTMDPPTVFVDKTTGDISVIYGLKSYRDPTSGMTLIGSLPG